MELGSRQSAFKKTVLANYIDRSYIVVVVEVVKVYSTYSLLEEEEDEEEDHLHWRRRRRLVCMGKIGTSPN